MTNSAFDGRPFKVVSEATGNVMATFDHLDAAQTYADKAHEEDQSTHFRVVEIVWRGGSKRLKDL